MVLGIVLAALVWCLWGVVSMHFVAPARLAESTVPHMVVARAIGGASGRVVMGVVVLAGTCATVHALLSAGAHMLAGMAEHGLLPGWLRWRQGKISVPSSAVQMWSLWTCGLGRTGRPVRRAISSRCDVYRSWPVPARHAGSAAAGPCHELEAFCEGVERVWAQHAQCEAARQGRAAVVLYGPNVTRSQVLAP